jgi:phenylalanyl-tRNA synthetase beta chain
MYFLKVDYTLAPLDGDSRFIEGRCAKVVSGDKVIGCFGEVHPQVLENWGCGMPTVACELDVDDLLEIHG